MAKKAKQPPVPGVPPDVGSMLARGHDWLALQEVAAALGRTPEAPEARRNFYEAVRFVLRRTAHSKEPEELRNYLHLAETGRPPRSAGAPLEFPAEWLLEVAGFWVAADQPRGADALAERHGLQARWQALRPLALVDHALGQGARGRKALPEELHAGFDAVLKAFHHYENDRMEPARQALQAIGLSSPFNAWKLLVRGLIAYGERDDPRADQNWSRLASLRPQLYHLVQPLHLQIQPAAAAALSAAQRDYLEWRLRRLHDDDLAGELRELHRSLATGRLIHSQWGKIEEVHADLKAASEPLAQRLRNVIYWSMTTLGSPQDVREYLARLGSHPHDPEMDRLKAVVMESLDGQMQQAQDYWRRYERWVADHPELWPAGQARFARAALWLRMGQNARDVDRELAGRPARGYAHHDAPLDPGAVECFLTAHQLAPEWIDPAQRLFGCYFEAERFEEARAVVEQLIERFPNDLVTLRAAEQISTQLGRTDEALAYARRALQANPLDRRLRERVAGAVTGHARTQIAAAHFGEARELLEEALRLLDRPEGTPQVWCLRALLEEKARRAPEAQDAERRLRDGGGPLAVAYRLSVEAARVKLPLKRRKELDGAFQHLLQQADAAALLATLRAVEEYSQEPAPYRGLATHTRKLRELLLAGGVDLEGVPGQEVLVALVRLQLWAAAVPLAKAALERGGGSACGHYVLAMHAARNPTRPQRNPLTHHFRSAFTRVMSAPREHDHLVGPIHRLAEQFPYLQSVVDDYRDLHGPQPQRKTHGRS